MKNVINKFWRVIFLSFVLIGISACSTVSYFSHLASGQFSLIWNREPVSELIASKETSEDLKQRLMLSQKIRNFAEQELALPVGDVYTDYTDLKRPYVVWNVYAAPSLSFESYTWCYPILGCLAYRGFYEEERANTEADRLRNEGYDVVVGGVRAYSTLGVFDDPLLNTFMYQHEVAFVELLIHEISHRKLYIKDDTKFNENFATAVALLGTERWYRQANRSALFEDYQGQKNIQDQLMNFLLGYKQTLTQLYEDPSKSEPEKLKAKELIYQDMFSTFADFKIKHQLDERYDAWVKSMNNASLSTLANYQELVPGFLKVFEDSGRNWDAFYKEVERISELDQVSRYQSLGVVFEDETCLTKTSECDSAL